MNETNAAVSTVLLLGHDGDWWDLWMLASIGTGALVGVFVLLFTVGSVMVHKREARAADAALELYKSETARRVADATSAGIAAGEKAGRAQADVDAAKVEIARQETLTANATAEAAKAKEKAAEANLKSENLRKQNLELEAAVAPRGIPDVEKAAEELRPFAGMSAAIDYVGESEPRRLAGRIAQILDKQNIRAAGWNVLPGMQKSRGAAMVLLCGVKKLRFHLSPSARLNTLLPVTRAAQYDTVTTIVSE
jgi:hypothetical protein